MDKTEKERFEERLAASICEITQGNYEEALKAIKDFHATPEGEEAWQTDGVRMMKLDDDDFDNEVLFTFIFSVFGGGG